MIAYSLIIGINKILFFLFPLLIDGLLVTEVECLLVAKTIDFVYIAVYYLYLSLLCFSCWHVCFVYNFGGRIFAKL